MQRSFDPGLSDLAPYEDPAEEEKERRATLAYDSTYAGRIRQGRSPEEAHAEANKAAGRARREVDRELEG